jgi:hypothetical protein
MPNNSFIAHIYELIIRVEEVRLLLLRNGLVSPPSRASKSKFNKLRLRPNKGVGFVFP